MYRPSMYNKHDITLANFAQLFNHCPDFPNITIHPNQAETFTNDGYIIDANSGQRLGFDWEFRDKYFANCTFKFNTLGQYERKLTKPSIQLSLQCDSTETGVAVGWHEDWLRENKIQRSLSTDTVDEFGTIRYTKNFKIYAYSDIALLKSMLQAAFTRQCYNQQSFYILKNA